MLTPRDFTLLPKDGMRFAALVSQLFEALGYRVLEEPSVGPDGGRDILVERHVRDVMSDIRERVVIQCKHRSHSGSSVNDRDVIGWQNAMLRFRARGYLLVTDTRVTENVSRAFREFTDDEANYPRWARAWDVDRLISKLSEYPLLVRTFFGLSGVAAQSMPRTNVPGRSGVATPESLALVSALSQISKSSSRGQRPFRELQTICASIPRECLVTPVGRCATFSESHFGRVLSDGFAYLSPLDDLSQSLRFDEVPNARGVAISADAAVAAIRSENQILLWNIKEEKELCRVPGARIVDAVLSPCGKVLFSLDLVSRENPSRYGLWEVASGERRGELRLRDGARELKSWAFRFSPDSTYLIGIGEEPSVWNAVDAELVCRFGSPFGHIWAADFSPDGKTMISAGDDGQIVLWDTRSWTATRVVDRSNRHAPFATFSPCGRLMAVPSAEGVSIYSAASGERVQGIRIFGRRPDSVVFSPSSDRIAVCIGDADLVSLWDVESGELLGQYDGFGESFDASFSPDGTLLLIASRWAYIVPADTSEFVAVGLRALPDVSETRELRAACTALARDTYLRPSSFDLG